MGVEPDPSKLKVDGAPVERSERRQSACGPRSKGGMAQHMRSRSEPVLRRLRHPNPHRARSWRADFTVRRWPRRDR